MNIISTLEKAGFETFPNFPGGVVVPLSDFVPDTDVFITASSDSVELEFTTMGPGLVTEDVSTRTSVLEDRPVLETKMTVSSDSDIVEAVKTGLVSHLGNIHAQWVGHVEKKLEEI